MQSIAESRAQEAVAAEDLSAARLEASVDRTCSAEARLAVAQRKIAALEDNHGLVSDLEEQLTQHDQVLAARHRQLEESEAQKAELEAQLTQRDHDLAARHHELAQSEAQKSELEEQVPQREQFLAARHRELEEIEALRSELEQRKQNDQVLATRHHELEQSEEQIERLRSGLEEAETGRNEAEAGYELLMARNSDLKAELLETPLQGKPEATCPSSESLIVEERMDAMHAELEGSEAKVSLEMAQVCELREECVILRRDEGEASEQASEQKEKLRSTRVELSTVEAALASEAESARELRGLKIELELARAEVSSEIAQNQELGEAIVEFRAVRSEASFESARAATLAGSVATLTALNENLLEEFGARELQVKEAEAELQSAEASQEAFKSCQMYAQ